MTVLLPEQHNIELHMPFATIPEDPCLEVPWKLRRTTSAPENLIGRHDSSASIRMLNECKEIASFSRSSSTSFIDNMQGFMNEGSIETESVSGLSLGKDVSGIIGRHGPINCAQECASNRPDSLEAVTWNLASPNNNPFEFWVTLEEENSEYVKLMHGIEKFLNESRSRDVSIGSIFTASMFSDLLAELRKQGIGGLEALELMWKNDYQNRRAIDEFLKDKFIGSKRLVSMPDRMTNTISTAKGSILTRPSPISAYQEEMGTVDSWWPQWKKYMFHTEVNNSESVCAMLQPIPRSKYPDLSEEEALISIPLQILALAIFDAILVHMLHHVLPNGWQDVKQKLIDALYKNRASSCAAILERSYASSDLIFLQEASASFVELVKQAMPQFVVVEPPKLDRLRNQNSLILVRRGRFTVDTTVDVTELLLQGLLNPSIVAPGDVVVATARGSDGQSYLLASFHSDSCGLSTSPVLSALHNLARTNYPDHRLVFGLDANTFSERTPGPPPGPDPSGTLGRARSLRDVYDFRRTASCVPVNSTTSFHCILSKMGMESCWGEGGHVTSWTTCASRTFLQPQLQKAVSLSDALSASNCHLKDWVLFYEDQLVASEPRLDNTGARDFAQRVFPAKSFPSDHAIVAVTLRPRPPPQASRPRWNWT